MSDTEKTAFDGPGSEWLLKEKVSGVLKTACQVKG